MAILEKAFDASKLVLDLAWRDPGFVRGSGLEPADIPVFTFHSLEPRSFERRLRFLKDGGYQAISLDAYVLAITGRTPAPPRSVLLTIDDGRATTWTVGHPILKSLDMRATAFLVTCAVHDGSEVSKTIGEVPPSEWPPLVNRDRSRGRPFVTWGEARAMRGTIDVASHTHFHARVPVSEATVGVLTEDQRSGYGEFDCPFFFGESGAVRGRDVPLGTPLPESEPRLSGSPAYLAALERYETEDEVKDAMRFDLAEARRLLRDKADVDTPALCYPWHVLSDVAKLMAAEAGYTVAFAGKASRGPRISRPGGDLFALSRVGEDYVERLPAPGRKSLFAVLAEKLRRRS